LEIRKQMCGVDMRLESERLVVYVEKGKLPRSCKDCKYCEGGVADGDKPNEMTINRYCGALRERPAISLKNYYAWIPLLCPLEEKDENP
jgi:hypothetical protein